MMLLLVLPIAVLFGTAVQAGPVPPAFFPAGITPAAGSCTLALFKGTWGFQMSGTMPYKLRKGAKMFQERSLGYISLNGAGAFAGVAFGETLAPGPQFNIGFYNDTLSGNYTLGKQCGIYLHAVYSSRPTSTLLLYGLLNAAKNQIQLITLSPSGASFTGCTQSTIAGRFTYSSSYASAGRKNSVDWVTYYGEEYFGNGQFYYINEILGRPTDFVNGTYIVHPNCIFVEIQNGKAGFIHTYLQNGQTWYISALASNGFVRFSVFILVSMLTVLVYLHI